MKMFQSKKQDKNSEKELKEMVIAKVSNKSFKVIIIKISPYRREEWVDSVGT